MHEFYTYVYPYLFYVFLAALASGIAGAYFAKKYRLKRAKNLFLLAIVLDVVIVVGYATSFALLQRSNDLIWAGLWALFTYWSFGNYRRLR